MENTTSPSLDDRTKGKSVGSASASLRALLSSTDNSQSGKTYRDTNTVALSEHQALGLNEYSYQALQQDIEDLRRENKNLKTDLADSRRSLLNRDRDTRDVDARGSSVAWQAMKFWTKVDLMKSDLRMQVAKEWLRSSRAQDTELDRRCTDDPEGFRKGVLSMMETDPKVQKRLDDYFDNKIPYDWYALATASEPGPDCDSTQTADRPDPSAGDTNDPSLTMSWTASVLRKMTRSGDIPNIVPQIDIKLGNKRMTSKGYFIELPPVTSIDYERHIHLQSSAMTVNELRKENNRLIGERNGIFRERHHMLGTVSQLEDVTGRLDQYLDMTKQEINRRVLYEAMNDKEDDEVHGHLNMLWRKSALSNVLGKNPSYDELISRHAENLVKNAWWNDWMNRLDHDLGNDDTGKPRSGSQKNSRDLLWSLVNSDVVTERHPQGEKKGTYLRSLGEYKDGVHAMKDWIPDSSFLSNLDRKGKGKAD
ncbi:hypothetical protein V865_002196 [Kwoniella europaea PYCC6329]|uniref:Uncharacterized protein n=1 Tax=Kwoniella europaea PYCC6329 TaxID=1423913 RepID=A0AAX4KCM7_9TREE